MEKSGPMYDFPTIISERDQATQLLVRVSPNPISPNGCLIQTSMSDDLVNYKSADLVLALCSTCPCFAGPRATGRHCKAAGSELQFLIEAFDADHIPVCFGLAHEFVKLVPLLLLSVSGWSILTTRRVKRSFAEG